MAGGLGEQGPWIPMELWGLAVELAERQWVSRISQALLVGFYSLQERVAACAPASEETRDHASLDRDFVPCGCSARASSRKFRPVQGWRGFDLDSFLGALRTQGGASRLLKGSSAKSRA
jgi:hypothetical protein